MMRTCYVSRRPLAWSALSTKAKANLAFRLQQTIVARVELQPSDWRLDHKQEIAIALKELIRKCDEGP